MDKSMLLLLRSLRPSWAESALHCALVALVFIGLKELPSQTSLNYALVGAWFFSFYLSERLKHRLISLFNIFAIFVFMVLVFQGYVFHDVMNIVLDSVAISIRRAIVISIAFVVPVVLSVLIRVLLDLINIE